MKIIQVNVAAAMDVFKIKLFTEGENNWVLNVDTTWGKIMGDIENQGDLMDLFDEYAKTTELNQKVQQINSSISTLSGGTSGNSSNITSLSGQVTTNTTEIAKKANTNDVYTKAETDAKIISAVTNGQVDLTGYLTKTSADTIYQVKGNYLTEHQSLSNYATKDELESMGNSVVANSNDIATLKANSAHTPDLTAYLTKSSGDTLYQEKGTYLTEHQSLAGYAKTTDIPTVPTSNTAFTNDAGYLTKSSADTIYQKQEEGTVGIKKYASKQSATYAQYKADIDNGYVVYIEDMKASLYDDGDDINIVATTVLNDCIKYLVLPPSGGYQIGTRVIDDLASYGWINSQNYATKAYLETVYQKKGDYATTAQLSGVTNELNSTKQNLENNYPTNDDMNIAIAQAKLDGSDVDLSVYALKSDLPAKTSDLENDSEYVSSDALANFITETDVQGYLDSITGDVATLKANSAHTQVDLSNYLTKTSGDTLYQPKGTYLTEHQSLDNYLTKASADTLYQSVGDYATSEQLVDISNELNSTNQNLENNYPTNNDMNNAIAQAKLDGSEVDLSGYALKNELPTKTSELNNDSGYINVDALASYIEEGDMDSYLSGITTDVATLKANSAHTPDLTAYLTKTSADTIYQVKGNYITEHQTLKTINNQSLIGSGNITITNEGVSYDDSEIKGQINAITGDVATLKANSAHTQVDLSNYLTKTSGDTLYQPKGTYLTEHQSLAGYAKTSDIPTVPTSNTAFTNDAGYLTGYTETDPTVPSWAKASTKPSYTASEVGAISASEYQTIDVVGTKADGSTITYKFLVKI